MIRINHRLARLPDSRAPQSRPLFAECVLKVHLHDDGGSVSLVFDPEGHPFHAPGGEVRALARE